MFVKEGKLTDFVAEFQMEQIGCPKDTAGSLVRKDTFYFPTLVVD